jgi:SH3 domain protein
MKYTLLFFIFSCLSFYTINSQAIEAYVSDDISIHYRSGPSAKYRIKGALTSGEVVSIVDSSSKLFYKIKTQQGKLGWIERDQVSRGLSDKTKIVMLENSLSDSIDLVKKQADEIHRLKLFLSIQKIKNADYTSRQDLLTSRISSLNNEINSLDDSNLIRWITNVGIISLFAIFLLFITSIVKKSKRYNRIL